MSGSVQLAFRPLTMDDVVTVHQLHGDPATNAYNPYGASPDEAASRRMLQAWVRHWDDHGYGYELVFDGPRLAGIAGAREDEWRGMPVSNLYWRLLPEFQGRGLSGVLARRALQTATSVHDGRLIVARMLPANSASVHVAENLGLHRRPDLDGAMDGTDWILYADRAGIDGRVGRPVNTVGP
jgi:[ribosomal protein S5]-alanine N-acetyltransferase